MRLCLAGLALALGACGAPARGGGPVVAAASTLRVTLYLDTTLVEQRVELDVPAAGSGVAHVTLGAGVTVDAVQVVDEGPLRVSVTPDAGSATATAAGSGSGSAGSAGSTGSTGSGDGSDDAEADPDLEALRAQLAGPPGPAALEASAPSTAPVHVTLTASAPHAGHYALTLAYTLRTLTWDAAYTLTTTPERTRAEARGALVIRNATALALPGARATVIDEVLGERREQLARLIGDREHGDATGGANPDAHPARPHELGVLDLADGETRVELYPAGAARALRSVLVYDPVGSKLDNHAEPPLRDEDLGLSPPSADRVTESVEVLRDTAVDLGLPAGDARLVERRPDGTLAVLADGRMFEAGTQVAAFDTIPIGVARGVTARRRRRDFSLDVDRRRLTEDFTIEVANTRPRPVSVVMLEHLYRGELWTIGFSSVTATKDGAQEISMRTDVPANRTASILYVVVYWWDEPK